MSDVRAEETVVARREAIILPASWLFVPGDRPDRIGKALASPADAVIADLEDAISPEMKEYARTTVREELRSARRPNVFVRVNGAATPWFEDDIGTLDGLPISGIVLPMAAAAEDVERADSLLAATGAGRWIVPLVETADGVAAALDIARASSNVLALAFGAGDYAADLGIPLPPDDPLPFLFARSTIVVAARAAHLAGAIDTPNGRLADLEGLAREARHSAALGFRGKLAIHPTQIGPIDAAYRPASAECERAAKICAAFERALDEGKAVATVDGVFVDAPIAQRARDLLARAAGSRDVGRGNVGLSAI